MLNPSVYLVPFLKPCKICMNSLPWMVCVWPWFARRSCCKRASLARLYHVCYAPIHAWPIYIAAHEAFRTVLPRMSHVKIPEDSFFVGCLESLRVHFTVGHHHRGRKLQAHRGLYCEFCFWWIVWIHPLETPFLCRPASLGALWLYLRSGFWFHNSSLE